MIKQFILLLIPFLFVGCGNADNKPDLSNTAPEKDPLEEAVDWAKLQNRNGDAYLPNTDAPYSGWVKRTFENGQVEILAEFTNGSVTRLKQWKENGIPKWDISYIKGKVGVSDIPFETFEDSNTAYHNNLQIKWYENGQKESESNFKNGILYGLSTYWYENGQKMLESKYNNGWLSTKVWKNNGEICPETNFANGNGNITYYYENNQKESQANFKLGKLDGLATLWYKSGQKRSEIKYKNGKKDGLQTQWHKNGQKWEEINYKEGELDGFWSSWNKSGQLEENRSYSNGIKITSTLFSYHPNGQKKTERNFEDDFVLDGYWAIWNESGQLEESRIYSKGEQISSSRCTYYYNGQKKTERNFKYDELDGPWFLWNVNGQIEVNATYSNGQEIQSSRFTYHLNGRKESEANYINRKKTGIKFWKDDGQEVDLSPPSFTPPTQPPSDFE